LRNGVSTAANGKYHLANSNAQFKRMLAGFNKKSWTKIDMAKNVARRARAALWPTTKDGGKMTQREGLERLGARKSIYHELIAASEAGIGELESAK
jgi:hypothetical protein